MSVGDIYSQTDYSDIFDHVRPDVAGVSLPMVERMLALVAIDFFRKTNAWEIDLDLLPVIPQVLTVGLNLTTFGDQVRLNRIRLLSHNGDPLTASSPTQLQTRFGTNWRSQAGTPQFYYTNREDSVVLAPIPKIDGTLAGQVSIKPSLQTRCMPEDLYTEYLDVLRAGVLGRLYSTPGRRWTNPEYAAQFSTEYVNGREEAQIHVMHEDTPKIRTTLYGGIR